MATETMKILGQAKAAATTNTDLITVGAAKSQIVSSLVVANTGAASKYRIFARIAGAAAAVGNALAYDVDIAANSTEVLTIGITLAATDVITIYSDTGNVAFTAFGTELS